MTDATGARVTVLSGYISIYENLSDEAISRLGECVSDDVVFEDPFNKLEGRLQLEALLRHTLTIENADFQILETFWPQDDRPVAVIKWRFSAVLPVLKTWTVTGLSEISFDEDGKVSRHVDYWDSGQAAFAKLPVIGWFVRRVVRRLALS